MASGTGLIMGIGIEQEGTMDRGIISEGPEFPMWFEICLLIFAVGYGIMSVFDTGTFGAIGGRGRRRNIGIGMITGGGGGTMMNARQEMPTMVREKKSTTASRMVGKR